MKTNADKGRKEIEFKEGDLVLVKLQSYRQLNEVFRLNNKICKKFIGSYIIKEKVSRVVAYKLHLLEGSRIHNCFSYQ